RRLADDADLVRVEVVLPGVGPDPADGRLAVVDLRRPDRLPGEAVADSDAGIFAAGDVARQPAVTAGAVAAQPGPAVDVDDHRQGPVVPGRPGQQQVQPLPRVVRARVGDVGLQLDRVGQLLASAGRLGRTRRCQRGQA